MDKNNCFAAMEFRMLGSGARSALPSPPRGVRRARQLSAGGGAPGIGLHVEPSSGAPRVRGKGSASFARATRPGSSRSTSPNPQGLSGLPSTGWTGAEMNRAYTAGHGEYLLHHDGAGRPSAPSQQGARLAMGAPSGALSELRTGDIRRTTGLSSHQHRRAAGHRAQARWTESQ